MESDSLYMDSYNELKKIERNNTCGSLTIDYRKLDERTAASIRLAIGKVVRERKQEISRMLTKVK